MMNSELARQAKEAAELRKKSRPQRGKYANLKVRLKGGVLQNLRDACPDGRFYNAVVHRIKKGSDVQEAYNAVYEKPPGKRRCRLRREDYGEVRCEDGVHRHIFDAFDDKESESKARQLISPSAKVKRTDQEVYNYVMSHPPEKRLRYGRIDCLDGQKRSLTAACTEYQLNQKEVVEAINRGSSPQKAFDSAIKVLIKEHEDAISNREHADAIDSNVDEIGPTLIASWYA